MPTLMILAQIITGSCKTPISSLGKVKFGVLVFSHLSMIFIYFRRSRESACLRFKKANQEDQGNLLAYGLKKQILYP